MRRRCGICGHSLTLKERLSAFGQREQITYPFRRADGTRSEYVVSSLCEKCRQRAEQHREEAPVGSINPVGAVPIIPHPRRRFSAPPDRRNILLLVGILTLVVVAVVSGRMVLMFRSSEARRATVATPVPAPSPKTAFEELPSEGLPSEELPSEETPFKEAPSKETAFEGAVARKSASRVTNKPAAPTSKPSIPSGLVVRVSKTSPQLSRGFWVTVVVPPSEQTSSSQVTIQFRDKDGHPYILTLEPSSRPGEWTRRFGLDETGAWKGVAVLRGGKRRLTAQVPTIHVHP